MVVTLNPLNIYKCIFKYEGGSNVSSASCQVDFWSLKVLLTVLLQDREAATFYNRFLFPFDEINVWKRQDQ